MNMRFPPFSGMQPLIGTVVGVGFFSIPFVFAQTGFFIALGELLLVGAVQIFFLQLYADLTLVKHHHERFLHIIGDSFGPFGKWCAGVSFFGTLLGALVAYILAGGTFLFYLFHGVFPFLREQHFAVFLGVLYALFLAGGQGVVRGVQRFLIPFFFLSVALLSFFALPAFHGAYLFSFAPSSVPSWITPLGVFLFSLSGISAIPEMRDVLGRNRALFHRAIFWSLVSVLAVYILFATIIVGIAGVHTPVQAIAAFAGIAPWMVLWGSLLGFTTVTTAYVNVGSALVHTLFYDFRWRFFSAWALIGGIPLLLVTLGVSDVIGVLRYAGGVLGAFLGILVLIAYEKARREGRLLRGMRARSSVAVFGVFVLFFVMFVVTLGGG